MLKYTRNLLNFYIEGAPYMYQKERADWHEVMQASLPLCLSYIPVGLACGVLLQKVGFTPFLTALISVLVFSGGAQFLAASMLSLQAPMLSTVLMTFFLELRYILLSSSMSIYMKKESKYFIALFTQSLNDENYAVNYLKYSTDPSWNKKKALLVNWFSMFSWLCSNLLGTILGSVIHLDADLVHFALTAMFIFMFVMQMKNYLLLLTGIASGILSVWLMLIFQNTFGLILATILASLAGYGLEKALKKQPVGRKLAQLFKHSTLTKDKKNLRAPLSPMIEKETQQND